MKYHYFQLSAAAIILLAISCFSRGQVAAIEDYLPVERSLTDTAGRKIETTILSMTATAIRFRRASDGREFDMPLEKLSPADQDFLKSLGKPGPIEKTELDLTVCGSSVKVSRLGNGPVGVVFFGHSGSGKMMDSVVANADAFAGLLPAKTSFFLWEYPESGPFKEVMPAIDAYDEGDKAKLRPDFKGVASEVLAQIRKKTGLQEYLLIGNSLGAGIVLWDYEEISGDPKVSFLLISPTEAFMPPISKLGKLKRTMLLSATGRRNHKEYKAPDSFLNGAEAREWVTANLDADAVNQITNGVIDQFQSLTKTVRIERRKSHPADFTSGHKTIGNDIQNDLLAKIIKVKLGMKPSSILGVRPNPYSLQDPYDVSWLGQTGEIPVTTSLNSKSVNVVKITLATGESAVIEMTNVGGFTKPGTNNMTYRWKYRGASSQPVQSGEGTLTENWVTTVDKATMVTGRRSQPGDDCTIRAGGINIEWCFFFDNMLHHYPSRASLSALPANAFDKEPL
jgi:hypothetical protein